MAITNSDRLDVYNGALRRLGSRRLASLTENREPRRVLDGFSPSVMRIISEMQNSETLKLLKL